MDGITLSKGQNVALSDEATSIDVFICWGTSQAELSIDASALLLTDKGTVAHDGGFVFYNQPESSDGSVRYLERELSESGPQERISVDLTRVPEDIQTIAFTASVDAARFGDVENLRLLVSDPALGAVASFDLEGATDEAAMLVGELYRRNGNWKLRAVGQGWTEGLAAIATHFGVVIDNSENDEIVVESPNEAPAPQDLTAVAEVPVEPTKAAGVRTRKPLPRKIIMPAPLKFADAPTWQSARLFSISGVGGAEEQEKRATSVLLATMMGVRAFARAICAKFGAPAGAFEAYLEVPFTRGDAKVIPDAVLKMVRGKQTWTALLEVKTGTGQLRREQIEAYLDVAKRQKYDVVISLSNDISPSPGELPVEVDRRKIGKTALRHISWAEIMHEARMVLQHRGVDDQLQAWLLAELLRYLEHPRSGAEELVDMGGSWVHVRESIGLGTLRAGDVKAPSVAEAWMRLTRHLAFRLTAELGADVTLVQKRKHAGDSTARAQAIVADLADLGLLTGEFKVPDAAGTLVVSADLRTNRIHCETTVHAPAEGTSAKRIAWLMRQIKNAPQDTLVEATFAGQSATACELLRDVRESSRVLTAVHAGDITTFGLKCTSSMGSKRSGTAGGFITSVTTAVEAFYSQVLQPMRPWTPAAPKLAEDE